MREKSNDRDELSFIGFAFPVSFGVLLISFILNSWTKKSTWSGDLSIPSHKSK